MSNSIQPTISLLDSVLKSESTRQEIGVEVLRKSQDVARQQGEAMIEMLEKSVSNSDLPRLDTYA
jgi:hypothetical protein